MDATPQVLAQPEVFGSRGAAAGRFFLARSRKSHAFGLAALALTGAGARFDRAPKSDSSRFCALAVLAGSSAAATHSANAPARIFDKRPRMDPGMAESPLRLHSERWFAIKTPGTGIRSVRAGNL
jgi:hypothetical protein